MKMKTSWRWLAIAAGVALACVSAWVAAAPAHASNAASRASARASRVAKSSSVSKASTHGKKKRRAKRVPGQKAPTPKRISEIQSALARSGYYQGEPNGKWDSNTMAAMQKFQSSNGLDATGKIDALSLQKLGLGSNIAGVSAPKPVMPSTASPVSPPQAPALPPASTSQSSAPGGPAGMGSITSGVTASDAKLSTK